MDTFQIRLEFLALLRRLRASQQSIAKVVEYAIRHATLASDDMWDCILTECSKTTLNVRLNILFLVDALLLHIVDPIGFSSSSSSGGTTAASPLTTLNQAQAAMVYLGLATRDIQQLILQGVVPIDNWDAVRLNASSAEKILASWKRLNVFDHTVLDGLISELQLRKIELTKLPSSARADFSKQDILQRIEEDRERHKRLRERAWILPAKSFFDAVPSISRSGAFAPRVATKETGPDALEVEFDHIWDNLGDLDEDDLEKIRDDQLGWWGSARKESRGGSDARVLDTVRTRVAQT